MRYLLTILIVVTFLSVSCGDDDGTSNPTQVISQLFTLNGSWTSYESGDTIKGGATEIITEPDDTNFVDQWNMKMMRVQHIWNITKGDPNVVVAIIDDGFNTGLEDLKTPISSWMKNRETFPQIHLKIAVPIRRV